MQIKSIERFFLNTLLRVSMAGVLLILLADVFLYPEDKLSITIDGVVLATCVGCYLIRLRLPTISILILTSVVLVAMTYQCLSVPMSTTNSLSVILLVGFIHSVMLKNKTLVVMHVITFGAVNGIFIIQFLNPEMHYTANRNEMLTITITYSIIYFILTYATAVLKSSYDRIHLHLRETNVELREKADEIEAQNEELVQIHENVNALNTDLERIVNERTAKIQIQNEVLLKYSYTNAHHLRGPVARLLGLANVHKLNTEYDDDFIISKMVEQAHEIDDVIRQINVDLDSGRQPGEHWP